MHDSYLFLTPVLTLLVVALVGFVGCDALFGLQHIPDPVVPPANLSGVAGDRKVDLTWDAAPKADKYTVKRGLTSGDYTESHDVGTNTSYTDAMLTNGTTYYYVVTATVGNTESANSNEVSPTPGTGLLSRLIVSKTLGRARNDFSGVAGIGFTVAGAPLVVQTLGRYVVPGSTGSHTLKLVDAATRADVPGGAVTLDLSTVSASGDFAYASLLTPITLNAGADYFLVSSESLGGDQYYDSNIVVASAVVSRLYPVYGDNAGNYTVAPDPGIAYGPVDLEY